MTMEVRRYQTRDREAVRCISHATGYMGDSAGWYWRHRESFADIWTAYYTDREPDSLFVSVVSGRVVGYLAGCVDSRVADRAADVFTRAATRYALPIRRGTAGFIWRGLLDSMFLHDTATGELDDPRWPSHLHVNLLPEARGCGAGTALMRAWFARLRDMESRGCHLSTLLENRRAIGFFERHGFRRFGTPQVVPGMRTRDGARHHALFMVRDAEPSPVDGGDTGES